MYDPTIEFNIYYFLTMPFELYCIFINIINI